MVKTPAARAQSYFSLVPAELLLVMEQYIRVADGVYELHFDGKGLQINLSGSGASTACLGDQLCTNIGIGEKLQSLVNNNTHFSFTVTKLGPLPKWVLDSQTALVVSGSVFHLGRPEKLTENGMADTRTNVYSVADSALIQHHYKITPILRHHPGHALQVRWVADKAVYSKGEKRVMLTMVLKNVGQRSVRFTVGTFQPSFAGVVIFPEGGANRGARDNQFHFTARHLGTGTAVPDTGNSMNFGGMLAPGAATTKTVDVCGWFKFLQAGDYEIEGGLQIPILAPGDSWNAVWDDLTLGSCQLHFE